MVDQPRVSPPKAVGLAVYPPGASFGPRRLRDFELVWVIEGDVEYRADSREWAAPPGTVVLCRPGTTDRFRFDPRGRTRHAYVHFDVLAVPADWPALADWPVVRATAEDDLLRHLFRHLLTWAARGPSARGTLTVAHLLAAFVDGATAIGDGDAADVPEAVARARTHITARLGDDPAATIGLDDLAEVASVSKEHLCRLFRTATGQSPLGAVRQARLERAAVLLARSNYAVAEVAAMTGFASPFHFSRSFKAAYGASPRAYRAGRQAGGVGDGPGDPSRDERSGSDPHPGEGAAHDPLSMGRQPTGSGDPRPNTRRA